MGVDRLLDALPLLPERYQKARLEVIGVGPLRDALVQHTHELGLDGRVTFRGQVSDAILSHTLLQADLAIVPSVALEGFGLATIEALWHGTPALVTPTGANPEVVAELDSDLIAGGADAEALAAAITKLLDRGGDWDRDRARDYVAERYGADSAIDQILDIYEEVLG
jgi:glycosyltransferase involved in cell wall biosynthesis